MSLNAVVESVVRLGEVVCGSYGVRVTLTHVSSEYFSFSRVIIIPPVPDGHIPLFHHRDNRP
jgi:hypothetical protein